MSIDYLFVGAGLYSAVVARELTDAGKKCLILDRRPHIGGNVYTKNIEGINVHEYGPHIFHCNDDDIWAYVNKFTKFNHYVNRPKVRYKGKLYSFPINLFTLYQMWGVETPDEAFRKLESVKVKIENPQNLEEWILSQVGSEIYHTFVYGYTKKQWGKHPKDLPSSIIRRLPIRLNFDDNYFTDKYQGIPIGGYTQMVSNMLLGIPVILNEDFLKNRSYWESRSKKIIYTGAIDEFFEYQLGELEYRGLEFKQHVLDMKDFQGNALINYTEESVPYTRICEHKHFEFGKQDKTVITKEYPKEWKRGDEAYYPINDEKNHHLFTNYCLLANKESKYLFGGRLGSYKYYDMHQVIASALLRAKIELS
jgi:UDP-galactopyranose mutase